MKGREELQSKVDKVALSTEKRKRKGKEKISKEFYEEVEKEVEELSPLEDEVPKPMKKRKFIMKKKALREQFRKRREEKERSKIEKDKGKLMKAGWMSSSLQRE
uniref:Protein MNN4-like n=1 Tax=Cucumis melo TaxID=3656 RepID=A0A9I9DSH5_CUCME